MSLSGFLTLLWLTCGLATGVALLVGKRTVQVRHVLLALVFIPAGPVVGIVQFFEAFRMQDFMEMKLWVRG
jgi:hypothetical protein